MTGVTGVAALSEAARAAGVNWGTAAAVVLAALAGGLMFGSPAPHRGVAARLSRARGAVPAAVLAAVVGAVVVLAQGTVLALGLVLTGAGAGVWWLVGRVRARRAAQVTADRVVEACEALAGELRAGQPPLMALRHCAETWPRLAPVALAAELGADVPVALRRIALEPGAEGLGEVAAAWRVSQQAGGTMAPALSRVADAARRRRATERLVASELASAQATARVVAALPVMVLAMGAGLGGDPWGFLLTTSSGIGCLGAGLLLALAGLAWIERIAASAGGR